MKKALFFGFILFFFLAQPALARSGCCSHHGGVQASGCGCNDGTPLSSICAPYYSCNVVQPTVSVVYDTPIPTQVYPTYTPYPTRKPLPTLTSIPTRTSTPTITLMPTITMTPSTTGILLPTLSLTPIPTKVMKAVVPEPKPQSNLWTWFMGFLGR